MKKHNAEFYLAILKPFLKKETQMQEKHYRKNISELSDGEYDGVLKKVFKTDMKGKDAYFINLIIDINGEEYSFGQYCSERSVKFLFSDILMPLGLYASEKGIAEALKLKDTYIKFEKSSGDKNASMKIHPIYEYKGEAPIGSINSCINTNNNINNTQEQDDMDEIPY